jgi:KaiC/GvpD/RAD55 family RecA-like ATPase
MRGADKLQTLVKESTDKKTPEKKAPEKTVPEKNLQEEIKEIIEAPENRIKTYIQGFDDKLGGGIPKGSVVLVAGEPGTLKSTAIFYIMYQNAMKENRSGIFISLEQGRDNLVRHLRGMGMDPRDVEDKVSIVDLSVIRKNLEGMANRTWLDIFKMYAQNMKSATGCDLLAIDSLPVLEVMARFQSPREDIFQLFEWLKGLNSTIFVISEMGSGDTQYGKHGEEFIADGIIHVKMECVDDANIQRRIRCVKMRGAAHSPNYFLLMFQDGAFQVARVIAE